MNELCDRCRFLRSLDGVICNGRIVMHILSRNILTPECPDFEEKIEKETADETDNTTAD